MSWTDLFKSKSAKLKADPRVRWFGKLPTYADYYNSPAQEPWAVEFNDWVLKGWQLYQSRRSASPAGGAHRLANSGWMIRLPQSGMTVFASIQDYGGDMAGRPFPICFYVGVPASQCPGPTADSAAAAAGLLSELGLFQRDVMRFLRTPGRFESTFASREADLRSVLADSTDASWTHLARGTALNDWFAGVKPFLKFTELSHWLPSAEQWGLRIARLESKEFEPTLRFPLAPAIRTDVQTAGWLCWLEGRMNLSKRMLTLVIVDGSERAPGSLTVIARAPMAEDFLLATPLSSSLTYVDDLARLEPTEAAVNSGGSSPGTLLLLNSWLDFVQAPSEPRTSVRAEVHTR